MSDFRRSSTRDRKPRSAGRWSSFRDWVDTHERGRGARSLFLFFLAIYTVTGSFGGGLRQNIDTFASGAPAQRLVTHGDLDMTVFKDETPWFVESGGRYVSNRPPGATLFAIPLYAIVWPFLPDDTHAIGPSAVAAVVVTAWAMALLYLALREVVSPAASFVTTLLYGLTTPTWSISGTAMWPHGPDQLLIAATMLSIFSKRRPWLLGVAGLLALLTRPMMVVPFIVLGCWLLLRRRWREAGWLAGGGIGGVVGFALWNATVFGDPTGSSPYTDSFLAASERLTLDVYLARIGGTLFDTHTGITFVTPLVVFAVVRALRSLRRAPAEVRMFAVTGVAYIAVHMIFNRFNPGFLRNYRYPLETITLLAPLVALGIERGWRTTRGLTGITVTASWGFVFQVLLVFEVDHILGRSPAWLPWASNS